ncbi:hypothetical protein ATO10_09588 [Actibacterium atlanticum]|uniref:Uncharacterized protein n=1 Tax=Actibacterium atlanticum TaxID=1461693 RepID=A0A058ZKD5_9RHOB|nr:hypothetical protein ATO10_09588 [Actibacterium atlanticum]
MGVLVIGFAMGLLAAVLVALAGGAIWVAVLAYVFVGVIAAPLVGFFALLAMLGQRHPAPPAKPLHPCASNL